MSNPDQITDLAMLEAKTFEKGQPVVIVCDPGRPGSDMTAVVTACERDGEIVVVSVESYPPAAPLALMVSKLADDTVKAPRSGGPPPHTLKTYDRRRSNRR